MVPISFALNVIHGFFGLIYYGATTMFGVVIAPKLSKVSSETVRELRNFLPSAVSFIQSAGIITIVFGAGQLIHYLIGYYEGGGMSDVYHVLFGTGWGVSVFVGGIFGIAGLLMGAFVKRDMDRLMQVYRGILPDDEVLDKERGNLRRDSLLGTALLTVSVIFMLVAVTFLPLPPG